MPRNLDRRVEILFPVLHPQWREIIMNEILAVGLRDNVQARQLLQDGSYHTSSAARGGSSDEFSRMATHPMEV